MCLCGDEKINITDAGAKHETSQPLDRFTKKNEICRRADHRNMQGQGKKDSRQQSRLIVRGH